MSDLEHWLKEAASKKDMHPELAANAAKIREAQDPKKPGAEKPDLYAEGKGRGKGGKFTDGKKKKKKKKWIPGFKELQGPAAGKTPTEKISSFREDEIRAAARDDIDREFIAWNEKKASAYTSLDTIDARRNMMLGAGIAAPVAFGAGIAAKSAWDWVQNKKKDQAAAELASSAKEPIPPTLPPKMAKLTDTQKGMLRGAGVEAVRALTTGALPAAIIAPKGHRLKAMGKGTAYSLAGRAIGQKADQFAGGPTGLSDAGGTLGGVAAGLQARRDAKKEKKKKQEEEEVEGNEKRAVDTAGQMAAKGALVTGLALGGGIPGAIAGARSAGKGRRLKGALVGGLAGMPGGVAGALGGGHADQAIRHATGSYGTRVQPGAAGLLAGGPAGGAVAGHLAGKLVRKKEEKKKNLKEKIKDKLTKKANVSQPKATVGKPAVGAAKGLGKLMTTQMTPQAGSAASLANVATKLTGEKNASFVQNPENLDLLKKILNKAQAKSHDVE